MPEETNNGTPLSTRTTVRRGAKRAEYRDDEMRAILRSGSVAHVAVNTDEGPLVLPMVYGVGERDLYLHGALANYLLKSGRDAEMCATITILDGLVYAKTPFNHSMNYRSVVIRGRGRIVENEVELFDAFRLMTDHIVPTWDSTRPLSSSEIKATRVLALPLTEMSAKVRTGAAINEPEVADEKYWSGYVPLTTVFGTPVTNADALADVPANISSLVGTDIHE